MRPRIVSLCSGYGGLDLAVEEAFDAVTVAHCEWEAAPSLVLAHRWPGLPNLHDVKTADWSQVDAEILTAGYPCQPFSHAGQRKGTADERHLWPHVAEAIRRVRPRIVVLENVAGHRSLGFGDVLGELAEDGYDAQWTSLRAADVGAPHNRERLFVLASDANVTGLEGRGVRGRRRSDERASWPSGGPGVTADADRNALRQQPVGELGGSGTPITGHARTDAFADAQGDGRDEGRPESARLVGGSDAALGGDAAADPASWSGSDEPLSGNAAGQYERPVSGAGGRDRARRAAERIHELGRAAPVVAWGVYEPAIRRWERRLGRLAPAPTEAGAKGGQRLSPRFVEWMMGLPAGWVTDVPGISRNDQLKMLGNGVCPQQAVEALRRVLPVAEEAA